MSISANMSLVIPGVGVTQGPQYASDVNSSLTIIDAHDHSPGKGVAITPSGLNINSDLPFNNNDATALRSAQFQVQGSAVTDLGSVYVLGVDLYYRDVSGNNVRLTQSGNVAGTPGSISGLVSPASASYNGGSSTFVWQSNALTPAIMDAGPYIFRNVSPSSNGITVQAPALLSSNYTLTLPALPASQKFMTLDASGNMSAPYSVDNSTIEINSNNLRVKPGGITNTELSGSISVSFAQVTGTISDSQVATNSISGTKITDGTLDGSTKLIANSVYPANMMHNNLATSGPFSGTGSFNLVFTPTTANRPVIVTITNGTINGGSIVSTTMDASPSDDFSNSAAVGKGKILYFGFLSAVPHTFSINVSGTGATLMTLIAYQI